MRNPESSVAPARRAWAGRRRLFCCLTLTVIAQLGGLTVPTIVAADTSAQERLATEWIDIHNSADVDRMAAFRKEHLRHSDSDDWQPRFRHLVAQFGTITVEGVRTEGDDRVVVVGRSDTSDDTLRFLFDFYQDEPGQIRQVGIEVGDGPGSEDNPLPELQLPEEWERAKPEIDAYVAALAEDGIFSGAVLIARESGVLFESAYGLASREFHAPNAVTTRFDVGSCNKDYTRVAILQLAADGKLSVTDTVGEYLPDYPNEEVRRKVTLQQLLDHRSGLGDYFTEEYWETPMSKLREVDDYIPIWGPKPLVSEPGTREQYSNYGYTVLGAIIEKVSGMSYPDYVQKHVFDPAGMDSTGFFETDAVVPDVAVGYTTMGPTGPLPTPIKNIYLEPAKGGPWGKSYSTARDLYRFYDAMMRGQVLTGPTNWLAGGWRHGGFALGGGGPGLNALVSVEEGLMVVVMANLDPPIAEDLALRLSAAIRGR